MTKIVDTVTNLINEIIPNINPNLSIYDISFNDRKDGDSILNILLESDNPIELNDLVDINHEMSDRLDHFSDIFPDSYILDVSSAGLEREIRNNLELEKSLDKLIKVSLYKKINNKKQFIGKLNSFDNDKVILELDNGDNINLSRNLVAKINHAINL